MREEVEVSSFGRANEQLSIENGFIQFKGKSVRVSEITGVRYWISDIEFYKFTVGRRYHIGFRTKTDQLDIAFFSWLGIGNKYFHSVFSQVIDRVWEPVVKQILHNDVDVMASGGVVDFGNCRISREGVCVVVGGREERQRLVGWEELIYEKKYDRLVLSHRSDHNVWTNLYYRDSWNIEVLMALLDWITKEGDGGNTKHSEFKKLK